MTSNKFKTSVYLDQSLRRDAAQMFPGTRLSPMINFLLAEWLNKNRLNYKVRCVKCNQFYHAEAIRRKNEGKCLKCGEILIEEVAKDMIDISND